MNRELLTVLAAVVALWAILAWGIVAQAHEPKRLADYIDPCRTGCRDATQTAYQDELRRNQQRARQQLDDMEMRQIRIEMRQRRNRFHR